MAKKYNSNDDKFIDWLTKQENDEQIDVILKQLLSASYNSEEESRNGFVEFVSRTKLAHRPKPAAKGIRKLFFILGAVLLMAMPVLVYQEFREDGWTEVYTAYDETISIDLNDGSTVKLGKSSKLIYPEKFGWKSRKVYLEGEAFFDIAKECKRTFVVSANSMDVTVFGTRFNVNAFSNESENEIALVDGSVRVNFKDKGQEEIILSPGELIKHDKITGEKKKQHFMPNFYESRINDKGYFFYDISFSEIAATMSMRSGIPIVITDSKLAEKRYYASFINGESINEMLSALNIREHFKIVKDEDGIYIYPNHIIN